MERDPDEVIADDRVDEIAAANAPGGQGAGGGAYGAGTSGEGEGLGGGTPVNTPEATIGGGTQGQALGDGQSDEPGAASDASQGGAGRTTAASGVETTPEGEPPGGEAPDRPTGE